MEKRVPYYLYRITPSNLLTYIDEWEDYQGARVRARMLRQAHPLGEGERYKLLFAQSRMEAETLLRAPRSRHPGEE